MDFSPETIYRTIGSIIGLAFAATLSYLFFTRFLQGQEKKVVKGNYTAFLKIYPSLKQVSMQAIEQLNHFTSEMPSNQVEYVNTLSQVRKKLEQMNEDHIPAYVFKNFLQIKKTLNSVIVELQDVNPDSSKIGVYKKELQISVDKIEGFANKIKK